MLKPGHNLVLSSTWVTACNLESDPPSPHYLIKCALQSGKRLYHGAG